MRPLTTTFVAIAGAVLIFGLGAQVGARSGYATEWWGPGMMGGYGMGPGMMPGGYRYGIGTWMMGPGSSGDYGFGMMPWMSGPYRAGQTPSNLSVDNVKDYFGRLLAFLGNPHVKLGSVTEKDADTITTEIVTTDKDGLVQRFAVNRHTGLIRPDES